jgi:hypothetical protein
VTPPAGGDSASFVTGKRAEKQGFGATAKDIYTIYGTPSDAYEAIATRSRQRANAFWSLAKNGDVDAASRIVRTSTGKSFGKFDDGTLHSRARIGGRKRRGKGGVISGFYVSNFGDLKDYIQDEQSHVWWLASGWADPLKALGLKTLPYGVSKHPSAPGRLRVEANDERIVITAENKVKYSKENDTERRIQYAMKLRVDVMQRAWDAWYKSLK